LPTVVFLRRIDAAKPDFVFINRNCIAINDRRFAYNIEIKFGFSTLL